MHIPIQKQRHVPVHIPVERPVEALNTLSSHGPFYVFPLLNAYRKGLRLSEQGHFGSFWREVNVIETLEKIVDVPVVKQIEVPQVQTIEKIVEIPLVTRHCRLISYV